MTSACEASLSRPSGCSRRRSSRSSRTRRATAVHGAAGCASPRRQSVVDGEFQFLKHCHHTISPGRLPTSARPSHLRLRVGARAPVVRRLLERQQHSRIDAPLARETHPSLGPPPPGWLARLPPRDEMKIFATCASLRRRGGGQGVAETATGTRSTAGDRRQ